MTDSFTFGTIASTVLVEGVKFLYGQATELLRRHREDQPSDEVSAELPPALGGGRLETRADLDLLDRHADQVRRLRQELADLADDLADPDAEIGARALELRDLLEQVFGQRLTFTGENDRPATGTSLVVGQVTVETLSGRAQAVGVQADEVVGGTIEARTKVTRAEDDSQVYGARIGRIGP